MWVWWWFIRLVKLLIAGIVGFLHAVVRYPRAAIPVIMIVLGYIWYQMPSTTPSDEEEKAWDAVLEHGRWKSYSEKVRSTTKSVPSSPSPPPAVVAEKPVEKLKPRPPNESVAIAPMPEKRRLLELPHESIIHIDFDMAFNIADWGEYLRTNPTSRAVDFVLVCAPVSLNNVISLPLNFVNRQYYIEKLGQITQELTPQHWGYRAVMMGQWLVFTISAPNRYYTPNLSKEAVQFPPVTHNDCVNNFGGSTSVWVRHYWKLTMTQ